MQSVDGFLSILHRNRYYNLSFPKRGWLAVDMVQYLDDLYRAQDTPGAILRLMGLGLEVSESSPHRRGDVTWIAVDLDGHILETNSPLIRKAVDQIPASPEDPLPDFSLRRIFSALDRHDFTVRLYDASRR